MDDFTEEEIKKDFDYLLHLGDQLRILQSGVSVQELDDAVLRAGYKARQNDLIQETGLYARGLANKYGVSRKKIAFTEMQIKNNEELTYIRLCRTGGKQ